MERAVYELLWDTRSPFDGLYLQVPGRVVVRYDAEALETASVAIVSDSYQLLELFSAQINNHVSSLVILPGQVVPPSEGNHSVLNITASSPDFITSGALYAEITLNKPVRHISTKAQTIVLPGALQTTDVNANLTLHAYVNGEIFYNDVNAISLNKLKLGAFDAGTVQLTVPSLTLETTLELDAGDNAHIIIVANDTKASLIDSSVEDNAAIYLESTNSLYAKILKSDAEDAGKITYYPQGSCLSSSVDADGRSQVNIGSIICENTTVYASDSSSVVVQSTNTLKATTDDQSTISYFNTTPQELPKTEAPEVKHAFRYTGPNLHFIKNNSYTVAIPIEIPPLEPVWVDVFPQGNNMLPGKSQFNVATESPVLFGCVVAIFAAFLVLLAILLKRLTRGKYQRLQ
ncbi:hypothetical protein THRCLA_02045 [Thraustotheca clavata]|uniref:Uncharacterized protein n=1 Tax=Thraustotheca clavata TaxID=74557 RepID=A0A1W0A6L5_9STRA|nr:hypothetical protein THRCLA_02045 [Thraustotheca clavata]